MADSFVNIGVNADNINHGFQQVAKNISNYSQTIHQTIHNVNVDMSSMYSQVSQYNTQVTAQFNQLNASMTSVRNNTVATNNILSNVLTRQEQQINLQNRVVERTAARIGQFVQGAMAKIGATVVGFATKMSNLKLNEIICNPVYINTGLVVYGAKAVSDNLLDEYESFLHDFSKDIYCPEQDFINQRFVDEIREIPAHFNLMFTD
ncbi:MAG: hypothetical protein II847_00150 [Ruminobacter sp.]|uniref:hypothetical protein n=1 Tax=Ruminobacter sp. TaxID=2774296 RepID=UPI00257E9492|nr:hypothetical protein [Ruminobacter sp.]MBQ3774527.1 hypothetical protein [Ruminobacter sp.]